MPPPPAPNSILTSSSNLDAPTEVVATGSRRTITVSWEEVTGSDGYTIAVRPANGTEPLEWVEYSAASSPHSISSKLVMSSLEYEVRVAAFNADGQSEWSSIDTVSVPTLQSPPVRGIWPNDIVEYHVGEIMNVAVNSQRPFENRSVWHWFVCEADESDCKLLPVPKRQTYTYPAPGIARGKFIKVQVDYDKDGTSYSATAVVGIVVGTAELGGAPTEVATTASNRQVSVSWNEVSGATGYRVSIRPKDGTQPLSWIEYLAISPPYIILDYWVMSGLEYEVRVSAFNDAHQSEWSRTATVAGPVLESAPSGAVEIVSAPPYRVGGAMHVSLASQHHFTDRSVWHWFLCDVDGSDCKLLPVKETDSHKLLIPEIARHKRVEVQSDYRKDGVFYTARVAIGIVDSSDDVSDAPTPMPTPVAMPVGRGSAPTAGDASMMECGDSPEPEEDLFTVSAGNETVVETFLYALRLESVSVLWDEDKGGAVEPMCDDLLLATPWGRIAVVRPNGSVEHFSVRVPMDLAGLLAYPEVSKDPINQFRVADILLKRHSQERWELFATHHYFTGECIRFRMSSTTIIRDAIHIEVSPAWRTIFDAEPCLPIDHWGGERAGGRMLMDGRDHLLVIIGAHGTWRGAQDSESHMGKLLRVEIETGDAEVLASGFRNSQGLTRDQYGSLWATDHGPYGGDELNLLEPGNNYGWPLTTYGTGYSRSVNPDEWESLGIHDGFALPVFAWIPSIGISSMIVNDAKMFPLWRDDLLIASLSGNRGAGHSLFRVRRAGADVQYIERIELGWRMRDLTQMPDGRISILGDDGTVYFMSLDYSPCHINSTSKSNIYKLHCESDADSTGDEEDMTDTTDDETS